MDAPFHGGSNDTIGGVHVWSQQPEISLSFHTSSLFLLRGSQFCRKNRPLLSQQFIAGFFPIAEKRTKSPKFIAGVNDTAENCSPMSMTPLIKFFAGVTNTGSASNVSLPTPEFEN
jgi:hypothetical protein